MKSTMRLRALPLAKAMSAKGHQITVLLPPWDCPEDAGKSWTEDGVRIVNAELPRTLPGLFEIMTTRHLVQLILSVQPDVVHAFKPKAYAGLTAMVLWVLRLMKLTDIRLVMDTDDWEGAGGWNDIATYSTIQRYFFAWQERWGLTHCDAVTVASKALQTLVWAMGVPPNRVLHLPNGIPKSKLSHASYSPSNTESSGAGTVLLYTRFIEFDVSRLLEIWLRVLDLAPSAQLVVVGEGLNGEENVLLQKSQIAGIDQSITYLGWPGIEVIPGILPSVDVAIMPFDDTLINRTKCTARIVELMGAGVPIIAEAVGQTTAYIEPGKTGILVPSHDTNAFAKAIVRVLANVRQSQKMGQNAIQYLAENFTWEKLAMTAETAYQIACA